LKELIGHYRQHTGDKRTVINQLFETFGLRGVTMPYTREDFRRDYTRDHIDLLTAEERLRGLSADEIERLKRYLATFGSERGGNREG
jgi:hypothetical protein